MSSRLNLLLKNKEHGFTLIETLLVLCIFTVLSVTALIQFRPVQDELAAGQFFEQFQKDLLYAQQHAVASRIPCILSLNEDQTGYQILLGRSSLENSTLLDRKLPMGMKIMHGTLSMRTTFHANGNISESGTLKVSVNQDTYLVRFYLGKGRFVVKKL
ncbi:prepilin-type N-terminal cleavage/methylation domain-containing protein [Bacillus mangrovi]|uniref:Prepilin-type N-terminal cleavage/methylation domain-containing protein n=1 Tax=Metabacillus mangrovi TaxID=1491830 RepID=A0A7X2S2M6_9BACI|nr:competence type IV pilus minor pilin ComGD [Metabacillus mangrovi]MTH52400.1 prepilin-type N-terminal cleavage/methylation domain-containing protein [Metabacillus mangrovi]